MKITSHSIRDRNNWNGNNVCVAIPTRTTQRNDRIAE